MLLWTLSNELWRGTPSAITRASVRLAAAYEQWDAAAAESTSPQVDGYAENTLVLAEEDLLEAVEEVTENTELDLLYSGASRYLGHCLHVHESDWREARPFVREAIGLLLLVAQVASAFQDRLEDPAITHPSIGEN